MNKNNYTLYILSNINNEYAELDVDTSDMTSIYSIENIQDISTRKDNITKDLTLTGTDRNNIALGNLYDISRYSSDSFPTDLQHNFVANKMIKCVLLENNIQVMQGSLIVRNIKIDQGRITYDCGILGNLVSFFGGIKDLTLDKVDYGENKYSWVVSEIINSWTNESPVCYPSVDYGIDDRQITKDENGNDVIPNWFDSTFDVKNFRPAVKLTKYLDSIFSGYKLDRSKINHIIKDVIIPYNEEYFSKEIEGVWSELTMTDFVMSHPVMIATSFGSHRDLIYSFNVDQEYVETYHLTEFYGMEGYRYNLPNTPVFKMLDKNNQAPISLSYDLTLEADQQGKFITGLCDISSQKFINSNNLIHSQTINKTSNIVETHKVVINISNDVKLAGEYIFAMTKEGSPGMRYTVSNLKMKFGKAGAKSRLEFAVGDQFMIKDVVSKETKVTEFLKSIMTLFNLYLVADPADENGFILDTYNSFYRDTINLNRFIAKDWTSKIDFSNYSISTNINLPKSYIYKYSDDSDMMNDRYKNTYSEGYGQLTVNDSNGTGDIKEQTVIFSPTINVQHSMDEKNLPIIYKADAFLQGKKKPFKSKIRIMYMVGERHTKESYRIMYRGNDYVLPTNRYGYATMIDGQRNLLFDLPREYYVQDGITTDDSNTLYNKYHRQQINDLIDENLIILECKGFLTENDISTIDMSKPIFLQSQYGNSYFKILEVEYINSHSPANIKLQKIVGT